MKSMTGFGRASRVLNDFEISIEVASLNSKKLEVYVGGPRDWTLLEQDFQIVSREVIERGKLKVNVNVKHPTAQVTETDFSKFEESYNTLKNFAQSCNIEFNPDSMTLWQMANQVMRLSELPDYDTVRDELTGCYREALEQMLVMRETEGEKLTRDIHSRLKLLIGFAKNIQELAPRVTPYHREQLTKRIEQAGLTIGADDERITREVCFYADKCDITEELTRLNSHFSQLESFLEAKEPIGRKIDFLIQEMNREINTIGSKANFLEITQIVVEAKNELERIREQIQNIE